MEKPSTALNGLELQRYTKDRQLVNTTTGNGELEARILLGEASPEGVLHWYFNRDPMYEQKTVSLMKELKNNALAYEEHKLTEFPRESRLHESAGTTLLASACFPGAFKQQQTDWIGYIAQLHNLNLPDAQHNFEAQRIIRTLCLKSVHDNAVNAQSYQTMHQLVLGSELLLMSSRIYTPASALSLVGDYDPDRSYKLRMESQMFYKEVIKRTLDGKLPQEVLLLGLKAKVTSVADFLYGVFTYGQVPVYSDEDKTQRRQTVARFIGDLRRVLVGNQDSKGLLWGKTSAELRGELHEIIWFLDAVMWIEETDLRNLNVFPACENENRPTVGYPHFNRGFDFMLINSMNTDILKIQLKSSLNPRRKKDYHFQILEVREENFQDINPRRLNAKLERYLGLLNRTHEQDKSDVLQKYILPSVSQTIPDFNSGKFISSEDLEEVYGGKPKNKGVLRRQKKLRKKADRRTEVLRSLLRKT